MRKFIKNTKGITLVALVITIIILLILAGITIAQLTGNGLFENAKLAKEKAESAQENEDGTLTDYSNKIGEYVNGDRSFHNDSTLIGDFIPITTSFTGDTISIECNIINKEAAKGYIYIINDKVLKVSEEEKVEIAELEPLTTYKIKVIAIDQNAKTRISKEVEQQTIDEVYFFKNGIINSRYPALLNKVSNASGAISIDSDGRYVMDTHSSGFNLLYLENQMDFTNIKSIKVRASNLGLNSPGQSCKIDIGLQSQLTIDKNFDTNLSGTKTIPGSTTGEIFDVEFDSSSVKENKYLKIVHGCGVNRVRTWIHSISFIYE